MRSLKQTLFLLLGVTLLATFQLNAQDRENKPLPVISKTVLWTLTDATGWMKSLDGQWLSAKNKIHVYGLDSTNPASFVSGTNVFGADNFVSWSARDIKVENQNFLLITKVLTKGRYKYASQQGALIAENKTVFFVVKKNYAKFKNEEFGAGPAYEIPIFYYGEVPTGVNSLTEISGKINAMVLKYPEISTSLGLTDHLDIFYALTKDPKKCRFFAMSTFDDAMGVNNFILPFSTRLFVDAEYIYFKSAYFELPTASFAGLISLVKSSE